MIVWDVHSGKQLDVIKGMNYISRDGMMYIPKKRCTNVEIWNTVTKRIVSTPGDIIGFNSDMIPHVDGWTFSKDNRLMMVVVLKKFDPNMETQSFHLKIYDTETGKRLRSIKTKGQFVLSPVFSPDNKLLATTSDNMIHLWNMETGEMIRTLEGHVDRVCGLSFSPDGNLLASSTLFTEQSIKLWDVHSGQLLKTLTGHDNRVYSVEFDGDGDRLVSASEDGSVKIWDVESGTCEITFNLSSSAARDAMFSPEGDSVVVALENGTLAIISLNYGNKYTLFGHKTQYINNGREIATVRGPHVNGAYWLMVSHAATGQMFRIRDITDYGDLVTLSHNGRYAVFSEPQKNGVRRYVLRDMDTLSFVRELGAGQRLNGIQFNPDDRLFVSAGEGIMIGDTETGKIVRYLSSSKFHYDTIVNGEPEGHRVIYGNISFSNDGHYIIYSDIDRLEMWDVEKGSILWNMTENRTGTHSIFSYDLHADTMRLVTKDGEHIKMWDLNSHKLIYQIKAHVGDTLSVAFSPDGKWIVSVGEKQDMLIRDAETGRYPIRLDMTPFRILDGPNFMLERALFSPDGRQIICSSRGSTTIVWDFLPLQQLIDESREQFQNRPLTQEERREYNLE